MPANLEWYDQEESILLCKLVGEFGIETYGVMEGQMPMMVREKDYRVDVILHLSARAKLPPLRGLFQELSIISNVMPPNFGIFVGVGGSLFLTNPLSVGVARWLIPFVLKSSTDRFYVAASLPGAAGLIHHLRETT